MCRKCGDNPGRDPPGLQAPAGAPATPCSHQRGNGCPGGGGGEG